MTSAGRRAPGSRIRLAPLLDATRWPAALAGLAAAALALAAWGSYAFQRALILRSAQQQLTLLAELKRDELGVWLEAQRRLAAGVSRGTARAADLDRATAQALRAVQVAGGYADVSLLRLDGGRVGSSRGDVAPHAPDPGQVAEALRSLSPVVTTIRREEAEPGRPLFLEVIAPVVLDDGRPRALLVLRVDPERELYPLLRAMPAAAGTAEVTLGEVAGDDVVYLAALRYRPDPVLGFRVPRRRREALMVQAAEGARGLIQGVDYRGVRALGAAQQVPGTRWLLVAKQDEAELLAPLWPRTLGTTAVAAAFLAAAMLLLRGWFRQRAAALAAAETLASRRMLEQAEAEARAGQAQVRAVLESAGFGISITDREGRFVEYNPEWARFVGYEREELATLRIGDLTHPDHREASRRNLEAVFSGAIASYTQEKRYVRKDGEVVWGLLAVTPIHAAGGPIQEVIGIVADITARKAAEEQLGRNERFLKAVTDALPGLVGYWDRDLRCTFGNARYREWFGRGPEQLRGLTMPEVLGEELFRRNEPHVRRALAGEPQSFEQPATPGALERHAWVHYIPDLAGDEVRGFFVLVSDITELKRAQHETERLNEALRERTRQAESASRAKSDFLANMSHEIRTPMNAIMGLSHLLQSSELAPKQRDYLARIQSAARSLLAIINDVLDLSKIEANKLEVERVAFELEDVFAHVESLVAEKAREKGLTLRSELPPEVPGHLVGDALRLGQVLLNLANNAVKFTERGWVALTVRVAEQEADCVRLRFTIRDTGIGISAEALGRLFQPFSQADGSTTRRFGGTGLGLSISRRLVELMGGELTVQSTPGDGSTFSFVIPLERRRDAAGRAARTLAGKRVLVVDDDPGFRAVAVEILSGMGMVLRTVGSGEEAIAALLDSVAHPSQAFDLLLLDGGRPRTDGIETARRVRADVRLRVQPVIVLTTASGRAYPAGEPEAGLFDGLLLKPVEPGVFRDVVEEAFRKRHGLGAGPRTAAPPRLAPRRSGKVLVAEDNDTNRMVVQELLQGAGLTVEEALDGREAVEKALRPGAGFDLVLMDVQMPEMDGFEATARIREVLPALPIVAMTAHAMERERQRCLDAGMVDHVAKPFEPAQIWRVVDRWIPGADAAAAAEPEAGPGPADGRLADVRFLAALGRDLETCLERLRVARSGGAAELAAEAAHALKGLALPAGPGDVRERARALEQSVRDGAAWLAQAEALEAALAPVLEQARAAAAAPIPARARPLRPPPAELRELLAQTARKIRRRSLGAKDHVDQLRAVIGSDLLLRRLEDALDAVNFAAAEAALRQLAEAMGLAE